MPHVQASLALMLVIASLCVSRRGLAIDWKQCLPARLREVAQVNARTPFQPNDLAVKSQLQRNRAFGASFPCLPCPLSNSFPPLRELQLLRPAWLMLSMVKLKTPRRKRLFPELLHYPWHHSRYLPWLDFVLCQWQWKKKASLGRTQLCGGKRRKEKRCRQAPFQASTHQAQPVAIESRKNKTNCCTHTPAPSWTPGRARGGASCKDTVWSWKSVSWASGTWRGPFKNE